MSNLERIDMNRIPNHIAVIMDGNGRWAKQRGQSRSMGHQAGVKSVFDITEAAAELGVKYLTLYVFSKENWKRPNDEVTALMALIIQEMKENVYMKNNARMQFIGDLDSLPEKLRTVILECIDHTKNNTGLTQVLAISYSSRWEIAHAVRGIANRVKEGKLQPEDISEDTISEELISNFMPDPDLLIRTGGEQRISNYLLWQCAYTEFYFCDTYWPDFGKENFYEAIVTYQNRERRYGKTSEQVTTI